MRRYSPFPNRNDVYHAMQCAAWYTDKTPADFMFYQRPEDRFSEEITPDDLRRKLGLKG